MLIFMGRAALSIGAAVAECNPPVGDSLVTVEGAVEDDWLGAQVRVAL